MGLLNNSKFLQSPIGFAIYQGFPLARGNVQKDPLPHPPSPYTPRRAFPRTRPQSFGRTERTDEYVRANGAKSAKPVSAKPTKDRVRRWRTYSTFPLSEEGKDPGKRAMQLIELNNRFDLRLVEGDKF